VYWLLQDYLNNNNNNITKTIIILAKYAQNTVWVLALGLQLALFKIQIETHLQVLLLRTFE